MVYLLRVLFVGDGAEMCDGQSATGASSRVSTSRMTWGRITTSSAMKLEL
jgi:hypothetical protein